MRVRRGALAMRRPRCRHTFEVERDCAGAARCAVARAPAQACARELVGPNGPWRELLRAGEPRELPRRRSAGESSPRTRAEPTSRRGRDGRAHASRGPSAAPCQGGAPAIESPPFHGPLTQLVRVPCSQRGSCWFESSMAHHARRPLVVFPRTSVSAARSRGCRSAAIPSLTGPRGRTRVARIDRRPGAEGRAPRDGRRAPGAGLADDSPDADSRSLAVTCPGGPCARSCSAA